MKIKVPMEKQVKMVLMTSLVTLSVPVDCNQDVIDVESSSHTCTQMPMMPPRGEKRASITTSPTTHFLL